MRMLRSVLEILIAMACTLILSLVFMEHFVFADVRAQNINIYPKERPAFEEQIKADEERIYQEWLAKEKAIVPLSEQKEEENPYLLEVTAADIDLMARVVMSECSIYLDTELGMEVAQAIAQTIVNRVRDSAFPNTVSEVVYQPNQYWIGDNGEPTQKCYRAVYAALTYEAFDKEMFYFREGDYHNFGREYTQIGNTYFSCR